MRSQKRDYNRLLLRACAHNFSNGHTDRFGTKDGAIVPMAHREQTALSLQWARRMSSEADKIHARRSWGPTRRTPRRKESTTETGPRCAATRAGRRCAKNTATHRAGRHGGAGQARLVQFVDHLGEIRAVRKLPRQPARATHAVRQLARRFPSPPALPSLPPIPLPRLPPPSLSLSGSVEAGTAADVLGKPRPRDLSRDSEAEICRALGHWAPVSARGRGDRARAGAGAAHRKRRGSHLAVEEVTTDNLPRNCLWLLALRFFHRARGAPDEEGLEGVAHLVVEEVGRRLALLRARRAAPPSQAR